MRDIHLSRLFAIVWGVPLAIVGLGALGFNDVPWGSFLLFCSSAAFAWWLIQHMRPPKRRRPLPIRKDALTKTFYALTTISLLGNYLLARAYESSGILGSGDNIQELYVAVLNQQMDNSLATGPLGSVAHLLRIAQPFAVICGVLLMSCEKRRMARAFTGLVLAMLLYYSYTASFSRGQLLFSAACVIASFLSVRISRTKFWAVIAAVAIGGTAFYASSATERSAAIGIDANRQIDALQTLFDFHETPATRLIAATGGPQSLGLVLYFTHSVVEGPRLMATDPSPVFGGGLTFFPYLNPLKRAFGLDTSLDMSSVSRANMWTSAIGEMYLDFSHFALLVFPAVVFLVLRWAYAYRDAGLWGRLHFILTAVFLLLFPLYSVFQSYGQIYAVSLLMAKLADVRHRKAARAARRRERLERCTQVALLPPPIFGPLQETTNP